MPERMGDGLVRIGAMSAAQVGKVLELQKGGDKRKFGEIAVALGFTTEAAIKAWSDSQAK